MALAAVCLWFFFRNIDFSNIWGSLKKANYWWLAPAMLFVMVSMVFRTLRWQCILKPVKPVGFMDLFSAIMICFMANNLLPARAGEFIRAILVGKKHNISVSKVLATVVLERIFDGMSAILLFMVLLFSSFSLDARWKKAGMVLVVLYFVLIVVLVIMRLYPKAIRNGIHRFFSRLPGGAAHKVGEFMESFIIGLNSLKRWKQVALILLYTAAIWVGIYYTYYYICRTFAVQMHFSGYLFLMALLSIAVMAPIPGYVGSFHLVFKQALLRFGCNKADAVSCATVAHASQYILIGVIGFICLWRENLSFSELREKSREAEKEDTESHAVGSRGT